MPAYMMKNTTTPKPSPRLLSSRIQLATHQYQTAYPEASLVMTWTWYVVMASTATMAWEAASVRTNTRVPSLDGPAVRRVRLDEGSRSIWTLEVRKMLRTGAARRNRGIWFRVQYLRKPTFLNIVQELEDEVIETP